MKLKEFKELISEFEKEHGINFDDCDVFLSDSENVLMELENTRKNQFSHPGKMVITL